MVYVIIVFVIIVCVLLILAILIQNPKGGGLGAGFGSMGNQVMGARRANDFIEKTTWSLVVGMLVLCLFSGLAIKKSTGKATQAADTEVENKFKENSTGIPSAPAGTKPGAGPQQQPAGQAQPAQQQPQAQPAGQPNK